MIANPQTYTPACLGPFCIDDIACTLLSWDVYPINCSPLFTRPALFSQDDDDLFAPVAPRGAARSSASTSSSGIGSAFASSLAASSHAARPDAAALGMSEAELQRALDEERTVLNVIARARGERTPVPLKKTTSLPQEDFLCGIPGLRRKGWEGMAQ